MVAIYRTAYDNAGHGKSTIGVLHPVGVYAVKLNPLSQVHVSHTARYCEALTRRTCANCKDLMNICIKQAAPYLCGHDKNKRKSIRISLHKI